MAKKKIPPGKKPREYDLLYLDDLEKLLFTPIEALSFIAEELRGRALAEIAGKRELKEELFDLKILYESGGLSKDNTRKESQGTYGANMSKSSHGTALKEG